MTSGALLDSISDLARTKLGWSGGPLTPEMRLVEDLNLDSIRLLTLATEVENRFRVLLDEADELTIETVGDLISIVERKLHG